jgi:excisionase family DNA binding protein
MTSDFNPTEWITTKEAAELTGYTSARFRQLALKGVIVARKWGRDWFLNRKSVLAYAEEMDRLGTAKHDPTRGQKSK